jgi:ribosome modulation factor
VPDLQEPFNAHGFERIKKFFDDGLRVGIRGFDREVAHYQHVRKCVYWLIQLLDNAIAEESWDWERVDRISQPQYRKQAVMEADR